jgi:hypothetical protein
MPDGAVRFVELLEDGPAWRLGARPGDALLRLDGREIHSANEFVSIVGTLPADWPVALRFRDTDGQVKDGIARTEALKIKEAEEKFTPDAAINLDAVESVVRRFQATKERSGASLFTGELEIGEGAAARPGRYRLVPHNRRTALSPSREIDRLSITARR